MCKVIKKKTQAFFVLKSIQKYTIILHLQDICHLVSKIEELILQILLHF